MAEVNLTTRARGIWLAALVGLQLVAVAPLAAVPTLGRHHEAGHGSTTRIGVAALTVPPGTDITIDENVALKRDQVGNTFSAHVTRNVVVDGAVAIPVGAPAE